MWVTMSKIFGAKIWGVPNIFVLVLFPYMFFTRNKHDLNRESVTQFTILQPFKPNYMHMNQIYDQAQQYCLLDRVEN